MADEVTRGEAQLLDVRSAEEWDAGHAAGALHLTVAELVAGAATKLDRTKTVYIYCASGARADRAARLLRDQGFDAENVGGLHEWLQHGGTLAA
jgi:rhodanese-related sulfurtransferase